MKTPSKYLKIILLLILFFLFCYLSIALYAANKAEIDTKTRSDAILILGARSYIEGAYNPCLKARVEHGVNLYKAKYAPKILVSGGDDKEDKVNEAETMKKIAVSLGVPANDVLLETKSNSTYENFVYSQKVLQAKDSDSIIIVTEPFHIARAALVAEKLDIKYTVSPAASPCWQPWKYASKYFLKEPLALMLYKLQGKL